MAFKEYLWACDPVGSLLFIGSATLMLLAPDWAGGAYHWSDPHVAVPLSLGLVLLVCFGLYEWKGRADGLVAHVFFRKDFNFALSVFAFGVEGWVFYSAVNSITPAMVLQLGFEDKSWRIAIRQLTYQLPNLLFPIPMFWYSTHYKDLKSPLLITFALFLVVCICYFCIQTSWSTVQYGINVLCGVGQAGPLALLVACVQFTLPHAFLSTATGLAYSARTIGGAFESAVLNAIINGRIAASYASAVGAAAVAAGLPQSSVPELIEATQAGKPNDPSSKGATPSIWAAAVAEHRSQYATAYRLAWASIIPFVVMAFVAVSLSRGVRDLMTEKVEATLENVESDEGTSKRMERAV